MLSFVLILIVVNVVLVGISSRANVFYLNQSEKVFIKTDGCTEEALIRLNRDNSYSGGVFTIGEVECTVSVSGMDPDRDITITGVGDEITRDLFIRVQLIPTFGIIDWSD